MTTYDAVDALEQEEQVVLLDEQGRVAGTAPKGDVHNSSTPLHLAFSCYVFDGHDRLLVTRRALTKRTWPGTWTNTCCGHPGPGEDLVDAVRRRTRHELGIDLQAVVLVLPAFRYRAEMPDGTVENEMCPVFVASTTEQPHPNAQEVDEVAWVPWLDFRSSVLSGVRVVSPWCREQVAALMSDPRRAPAADLELLPVAARLV